MGEEIPIRYQQLGERLGRYQPLLPVPGRDPPDYVYHQHYRRAQPPVLEKHQDKKRVPQRRIPGEDAVPGKPECGKKVDTEIPELGSGAEPADCPVWGTANRISVNAKRPG